MAQRLLRFDLGPLTAVEISADITVAPMGLPLRQHHVQHYWPYLPTFRVVAEVRNVTEAAQLLFVTPSAISKTLRRLEEMFGERLFDREGGKLELTVAGERLLAATRTALRTVEDAWFARDSKPIELRLAVESPLEFLVGSALGKTEPIAHCAIASLSSDVDVEALLLRGEVDLVIKRTPTRRPAQGVDEARLGTTSVLNAGVGSFPLGANIGLALAGRKASLPLALATRLGFTSTNLESILVFALMREAAPQGQAVRREIDRVIAALKRELGVEPSEE